MRCLLTCPQQDCLLHVSFERRLRAYHTAIYYTIKIPRRTIKVTCVGRQSEARARLRTVSLRSVFFQQCLRLTASTWRVGIAFVHHPSLPRGTRSLCNEVGLIRVVCINPVLLSTPYVV